MLHILFAILMGLACPQTNNGNDTGNGQVTTMGDQPGGPGGDTGVVPPKP